MCHKNGLDGVYYNPTIEKRFEEFHKAIPELTISSKQRHELQIQKQQEKISKLERDQQKIVHLEEGLNVVAALMAEQRTKNHIWNELENPTHHHTEQQISQLKKFCSEPHDSEIWNMFLKWSKNGPKVYHSTD